MVRLVMQRDGIGWDEAVDYLKDVGQDARSRIRARVEEQVVQARRKRAGSPVYKPRDDYTGKVRKG